MDRCLDDLDTLPDVYSPTPICKYSLRPRGQLRLTVKTPQGAAIGIEMQASNTIGQLRDTIVRELPPMEKIQARSLPMVRDDYILPGSWYTLDQTNIFDVRTHLPS
jgi:hypothetical protein